MEGGWDGEGGQASAWGAALLPSCLPLPAWPGVLAAPPASSRLYLPADEASHTSPRRLRGAARLQHLCPGVGSSILHQRPAEASGFLFYSKDVETFWRRWSRSLPAHFEKYPASVEHLSVKGEEIPPPLLFSPDCSLLVWLWLLWVCKIELYMTFYLTRNRLSHF